MSVVSRVESFDVVWKEKKSNQKSFNKDSEPGTTSLESGKDRPAKAFQTLREKVLKSRPVSSN